MSLTNLQVFNKWTYTALNEMIAHNINLFNQATRGAIVLRNGANVGDFADSTFWKLLSGAVRRRDAYGSGSVSPIQLQMILDTMVKVAAGTPPIEIDPGMFTWIGKSPQEGGVVIAQQLAPQILSDMLNTAVAALVAALSNVSDVFTDISGGTGGAEKFSPAATNTALSKFGDRRQAVVAWIVHSKPMSDYFGNAITNANTLYKYDTVNVIADPFGNVFVISDCPALVISGSPTDYVALGLTAGAAIVERNSDYYQNIEETNGDENIQRTLQAEWSYNLGLKGFTWDKSSGGKSPSTAALATAANWDKNVTSHKDLAGVALRTQ
jgi:hypothetical protein